MRLRRCYDDHAIDSLDAFFVIGRELRFGESEFPRRLQSLRLDFSHIKLDRHCGKIAKMVHTPSAQAQQQDFSHENYGAENFNAAREDPNRCPGRLE
jgi:hypothetical protein